MANYIPVHGNPNNKVFGVIGSSVETDEGYTYIKKTADTLNTGWENLLVYIPPPSPTPTVTPTQTVTPTITPTVTPTVTITPTVTPSSGSIDVTPTPSVTLTITPTVTATPTVTPTVTITPTVSPTTPAPEICVSAIDQRCPGNVTEYGVNEEDPIHIVGTNMVGITRFTVDVRNYLNQLVYTHQNDWAAPGVSAPISVAIYGTNWSAVSGQTYTVLSTVVRVSGPLVNSNTLSVGIL